VITILAPRSAYALVQKRNTVERQTLTACVSVVKLPKKATPPRGGDAKLRTSVRRLPGYRRMGEPQEVPRDLAAQLS
jgi:hypothetical protein